MPDITTSEPNLSMNPRVEHDRALLNGARARGRLATTGVFVRLSGPGWLQSAITLGGGTLSSSLYLGVLGGFCFLWLQPLFMILGIVMLSAISYVTLSTGERPFRAIIRHVNPVLGWGWLLASMAANLVWSMPQFALATASFQQNLLPGIFGDGGLLPVPYNKIAVAIIILAIAGTAGTIYSIGGRGMKIFEIVVKCLVGATVLCFISVVVKLSASGVLDWAAVAHGFTPSLHLLSEPVDAFKQHIALVPDQFQSFWTDFIVAQQRDVMISAAATAVGINMTFMLPYSMLRKGWDRDFRELAIFDLATGLFFPFMLATSCVVIAAASQFHATPAKGFVPNAPGETMTSAGDVLDANGAAVMREANLVGPYRKLLQSRLAAELGAETAAALSPQETAARIAALPEEDRRLAAMLVTRDAFNLAGALAPLTGDRFAHFIFGFGVLAMGMGAATMLMLINGLCFCELLNRPAKGWPQRAGMAMVSVGILGPFFWTDAKLWLAIPTSIFAMTLLPLAYFSFFALMNRKKLMGEHMPKGAGRVVWNVLMAVSSLLAAAASIWSIYNKLGNIYATILLAVLTAALVAGHFMTGRGRHQDLYRNNLAS